ncbi:MAG: phosphoribosylanthranilate isomerase [Gemmatimonadota bacterium]|nr:phosphoribosylanthranilate isomerase [Gemmatimonadota bacterium]
MTVFKVCCISAVEEAALALEHGAAALGLVSTMPSGPGVIDDARIAAIAAWAPRRARTFLLTARRTAVAIAAQVRAAGTTTVQLVDAVPIEELQVLRTALPGVSLVQVIHVRDGASVDEALAVAPFVDELLLDSGNPALAVKELGGTGRVHDWALSRRIVEAARRPVWLAGGLRPENARAAIEAVGPDGLDVCSGLRIGGLLDTGRLEAFAGAVRG